MTDVTMCTSSISNNRNTALFTVYEYFAESTATVMPKEKATMHKNPKITGPREIEMSDIVGTLRHIAS